MKLIVIGAGPAGESAARFAAKQKAKVLLVEKENLGGLCLNRGCIPSKTLLSFTKKLYDLKKSPLLKEFFGPRESFSSGDFLKRIQEEKGKVVKNLRENLRQTIQTMRIETVFGQAKFISENQISILTTPDPNSNQKQERIESFDRCVIAVGSMPLFPEPLNRYQEQILDSDRALELNEVPKSMVIVGGGAIGCEFASLFHELGSKIIIVEKAKTILPGEDEQIVNLLHRSFEKRGVQIFNSTTITQLNQRDSEWEVSLSNGEKIFVQKVLVCTGRQPSCSNLGLENAQVRYSSLGIEVNEFLASSNPNIYAVGDVNGLSLLAHAGSKQGEIAAMNVFGSQKTYNNSLVPRCLYSWPEVASVGLWNYQALAQGIETKKDRFFFGASGKALADNDTEGFIQILSDIRSDRILGAQIIGPHATEMIHIISIALHKNMTRGEVREIIFAHPTLSEGIQSALNR